MQTLLIGRDAINEIVLNDQLVSRQHAQLTFTGNGQVTIKDLGSSNGTYVNGNRISECNLNKGDIVKCGPVFLNWIQYVNGTASTLQQNSQQHVYDQAPLSGNTAILSINQFSLADVFRYLSTRIFEIGDLFKTDWDKTSSIWFLKLVPVITTLIISLITYSKLEIRGFYFSPTIFALFLYAICPFITLYLLSINKSVRVDKVALASGIMGFLQFLTFSCVTLAIYIYQPHTYPGYTSYNNYFPRNNSSGLFAIITMVFFVIILVNLAIASYLNIYKYFISIGFTRSKSIYLIITTIGISFLLQLLSAYVIFLVAKESIISNNNF